MKNGIKCLSWYGWDVCVMSFVDSSHSRQFCIRGAPIVFFYHSFHPFSFGIQCSLCTLCGIWCFVLLLWYVSVKGIHWCWHSSHCFCNHFPLHFSPFVSNTLIQLLASFFLVFGFEIFSFLSLFSLAFLQCAAFTIFRWICVPCTVWSWVLKHKFLLKWNETWAH